MPDESSTGENDGYGGQNHNGDPAKSSSGLDSDGVFRVGARISIMVRGDKIAMLQANSAREVIVSESDFEGMLLNKYFTDDKA